MPDTQTPVTAPAAPVDPMVATATPAAPAAPQTPAPAAPAAPETPAAPVAPVQPAAAPAPAPEPVVPAAEPAPADVYQPSHADPRVQGVESMLAEKGLSTAQVQEIFAKAFETQDVKDVDMQKLKEHLGEAGAKLAMQNLEAFSADVARAAKTLYDTAVNLTGGEEGYKQFSQWVQASADADVQQLCDAVAQGGRVAYLALDELNKQWRTQSQHAVGTGALLTPDSGNAAPSVQPFSNRREYVNAMKEAHKSRDAGKIATVQARFAAKPV